MINYVYVWFANFRLHTISCVFSDVLIEIFVLHRYFSQYLSLYEVFNVHSLRKAKPLEVSSKLLYQSMLKHFMALTESLSVIRKLNHLNSLITGKTSYSFFNLAATCFPIPSPV